MGAPAILLGASTAVSSYGSYKQGKAQAAQYAAQADIERQQTAAAVRNMQRQIESDLTNAELAAQDAKEALSAASLDEDVQRRMSRQTLASQRAAMIQNGIADTFTGQALEMDAMMATELDALNIRYAGQLQSRQFMSEADAFRAQAEQTEENIITTKRLGVANVQNLLTSGRNARSAGNLSAAGTLLGGAGNVMSARKK